MHLQLRFRYLFFMKFLVVGISQCQELTEFHRNVLDILKSPDYLRNSIPTDGDGLPLRVSIGLGLREIEYIDDKNMEIKAQLSLKQSWIDDRLQYESKGKEGYVTLPFDIDSKPWTPDIFVNNEKDSTVHSITKPNSFFRIYPNGTIHYTSRVSIAVSCFMNLSHFPFDKQSCELRMSSYSYYAPTLELFWDTPVNPKAGDNKHLTMFRILRIKSGKCLTSPNANNGQYSAIFVIITFQRQVGYFLLQVYSPAVLFVCLSWISFWLGSAVEARLSYTVTILLTLTTQLSAFLEALPQVSYMTALDMFSSFCILFGVISVFQSAVVLSLLMSDKPYYQKSKRCNVEKVVKDKVKVIPAFEEENKQLDDPVEKTNIPVKEYAHNIDQLSKICIPFAFLAFLMAYCGYLFWYYWVSERGNFEETESALENNSRCYDSLRD